ncbi:juvenile hormone acid O-methyltransferase-like [Diachasmimorpha longicaudata]|uniref:juvenile hormone acid O-methyltransferase-like n=1 Tax=Diachasmimorpha longicaudata TaxID=58733 RepID=UPI0030B8F76D
MNDPELYVASMDLQNHDAREVIEEFVEEFKAMNGRIIDIGCGPGIVLKDLLLPNVGENVAVVGVDKSDAMLAYAKEHYADDKRLSFINLNIETSDLPKNLVGQFNYATAFYCLNWCRQIEVAVRNIYELLQPGGKSIVLMISHHIVFDFYLEQQADPKFSGYMQDALKYFPPHYGCPSPETKLRRQLERARLKVLHCTNRTKIYDHKTVDSMLEMLMAVNPFLHRMSDDVQKEYRKDMETRIRNNILLSNDELTTSTQYTVLVAVFEKPKVEMRDY